MKNIFLILLLATLVASCSTSSKTQGVKYTTMGEQYPLMYEEKPGAIAIMPPINQTTHAEAKDYFYTTLYAPLCEKGYYVYSPNLTMELYQSESGYDAERFVESDISIFNKVLGADAVMFTKIKSWQRMNAVGNITVDVEYILRSTKTGQILYTREGIITVNKSINTGLGGVFGMIADYASTAINTAATDKVVAGRKCNSYVLSDLPAGKYSANYEKDKNNVAGKKIIQATVK